VVFLAMRASRELRYDIVYKSTGFGL